MGNVHVCYRASWTSQAIRLRHSKTVGSNTTTYTWDVNGGLPVVLQDGAYTYIYDLGRIGQTDSSGNQDYFLSNSLGFAEALPAGHTPTGNHGDNARRMVDPRRLVPFARLPSPNDNIQRICYNMVTNEHSIYLLCWHCYAKEER